MNKTALITGASTGIGYELSKIFSKNGYNLVLVARSQDRLEKLASKIGRQNKVQVDIIVKDLSQADAAKEVYDQIQKGNIKIDVLVNNAGIGIGGKFSETPLEQELNLIALNITSLAYLCKRFAGDMVKNGQGKILNVASTEAFQPGPYMSNYYASKAYVIMLSEGLNLELKKDGITVTALCPGPTKTNFFNRADIKGSYLANSPHMMSPKTVAELGFAGLMKGKTIVIPGLINKLLAFSVRLTPRCLISYITGYLNKR
ncbi:MAG: SDR family oxidoreductase [Desulfobacter sp.]|nr:MAG: SDR family oxidoreductase [Desulfobacter sp.]